MKFFGVELEIHWTFSLLILIIAVLLWLFDPGNFIGILMIFFFLFLSVFLHELTHSLVANSRGYKVKKIILLPIGGVAITEKMPEKPLDEFLIAVSGPLFNFVLAFLIILIVSQLPFLPFPNEKMFEKIMASENFGEQFNELLMNFPLYALVYVNIILGAFNLFTPALPLDGGRVLRSLLATKLGFLKATKWVSKISIFIAFFLFILGFLAGNVILIIIAAFVYLGANFEYQTLLMKETLKSVDFKKLIIKRPFTIKGEKNLEEVFEIMQKKNLANILVKSGKKFGLITAEHLKSIKRINWFTLKAEETMLLLPIISLKTKTSEVEMQLISKGLPFLPVVEKNRFLGVIEQNKIKDLFELTQLKNEKTK